MLIEKFDGADDVVSFVELNYNDDSILEYDDPIVIRVDGNVVAVGNYAESRVEIVTDSEEAALAVCRHFGQNKIKEVDCSNQMIAGSLQRKIDHPFADC